MADFPHTGQIVSRSSITLIFFLQDSQIYTPNLPRRHKCFGFLRKDQGDTYIHYKLDENRNEGGRATKPVSFRNYLSHFTFVSRDTLRTTLSHIVMKGVRATRSPHSYVRGGGDAGE